MKKGPAEALAGFAIAGIIAYLHSRHIWPFNSIFNEVCALVVLLVLILVLRDK
jgi:hypothetical protein